MSAESRRLQRLLALQLRLEERALMTSRSAAANAVRAAERLRRAQAAVADMGQSEGSMTRAAILASAHWRGMLGDAVAGAVVAHGDADCCAKIARQQHNIQQKRREQMEQRLVAEIRTRTEGERR